MATRWISTSGTDTNNGTSYADAVKTLTRGKAVTSQGDTLYVVNDGTHAMTSFGAPNFTYAGTNYTSDVGINITGATSNATPAMATVAATASNRYWIKVANTANYVTIQGIKFDYTALKGIASPGTMLPVEYTGNIQNNRLLDCECWFTDTVGSAMNITSTSMPIMPWFSGASVARPDSVLECARNVLVNSRMTGFVIGNLAENYHNNVLVLDADGYADTMIPMFWGGVGNPVLARRFYNNTIVVRRYTTDKAQASISSGDDDTALLAVHSNLLYTECGATTAADGLLSSILSGVNTASQTPAVTTGYDLIALGPNVEAFRSGWTTVAPGMTSYQFNETWRGGGTGAGTNVETNTDLVTSQSLQEVFNATTAAWTWTPATYSHNLPYDMRPLQGLTTALSGAYAGAIAGYEVIPPGGGGGNEDGSGGGGAGDPSFYPNLIDSLPFYRPVFKANTQAMVQLHRNDNRQHIDIRHYLRDELHDESTSRTVEVPATSGRKVLTLGGVATSQGVIVETDQTVAVSFVYNNGTTNVNFTANVSGVAAFDQVAMSSIIVNNTSSTTATVNVAVFD